MEEHPVFANSVMVPIKEDPDLLEEEEDEEIMVGCEEISPKQCQKLQHSWQCCHAFEGLEISMSPKLAYDQYR